MPLRLTVIKNVEYLGSAPASVDVDASALTIGRDQNSGWSLPDPTRLLSSHHCTITPDKDGFRLTDASTNGTFLNGSTNRLPSDHILKDGDRVMLGPYVVAVAWIADAKQVTRVPPPPKAAPALATPKDGDPAAIAFRGAAPDSSSSSMTIIRPAQKGPSPGTGAAPPQASSQATTDPGVAASTPDGESPKRTRQDDVWSMPEPATATPPAAKPAQQPVAQPRPSDAGERPAPQDVSTAVRDAIAQQLGVGVDALPNATDAELVAHLTGLVTTFAAGIRRLMSERNRLLRDLSSRQFLAARRGEGELLALMPTDADAVVALLMQAPSDAEAVVADAFASLAKQHASTGPAALDAAQMLADLLSPARLSRVLPRSPQSERWLASYGRLWHDMAPDWSQGFAEAFRLQFGAALDERSARTASATGREQN